MNFNRSVLILASVLALTTTACSKKDDNKTPAAAAAVEATTGAKTTPPEDQTPKLTVESEQDGEEKNQKIRLSFPVGAGQFSIYEGNLKQDSEFPLTSSVEGDVSNITALAYGPAQELVVAVRETPTDANGLVSTAFLFIKKPDTTEYTFLKMKGSQTVNQVREYYGKLAQDETVFNEWYQASLKGEVPPSEKEQDQQQQEIPETDDGSDSKE